MDDSTDLYATTRPMCKKEPLYFQFTVNEREWESYEVRRVANETAEKAFYDHEEMNPVCVGCPYLHVSSYPEKENARRTVTVRSRVYCSNEKCHETDILISILNNFGYQEIKVHDVPSQPFEYSDDRRSEQLINTALGDSFYDHKVAPEDVVEVSIGGVKEDPYAKTQSYQFSLLGGSFRRNYLSKINPKLHEFRDAQELAELSRFLDKDLSDYGQYS